MVNVAVFRLKYKPRKGRLYALFIFNKCFHNEFIYSGITDMSQLIQPCFGEEMASPELWCHYMGLHSGKGESVTGRLI